MSQYDFGDLESPLSGTSFFNTHLEPWRDALHSMHSGSSRPSYAVAGMMWIDNTTTPWVLKMFNGTANDVTLGTINATSLWFTPAGVSIWGGNAGGTANAITITPTIPWTAYTAGKPIECLITADSTSSVVTVNISALGTKNIKASIGAGKVNIPKGALLNGMIARLVYDGTDFILLNVRPYNKGADVATAGTLNLNTTTGDYVSLTGTTTVTSITLAEGLERTCVCAGIFTLTDGTGDSPQGIICPGGANITTAAGDVFVVRGEAGGTVRVVSYTKASGEPIAGGVNAGTPVQSVSESTTTSDSSTTTIPYDNTIPQQSSDGELIAALNCTITPQYADSLLLVEAIIPVVDADGSRVLSLAAFRDATEDAIAVSAHTTTGANYTGQMHLKALVAAGSTSATTFKLHYGPNAGTMYMLRNGAGNLFGGVAAAMMTVTEIKQ